MASLSPTPIFNSVSFEKWHGVGNDFVLIDDPGFDPEYVHKLCHRRYGIGADGLIWFLPPDRMRFFNADGSEAACCGNALRCLAAARNLSSINQHEARKIGDQWAVNMGRPKFHSDNLVDTGVPHLVLFDDDFTKAPLLREQYDANVNFVKKLSPNRFSVRTYERGVEGETYACGTGAVAVAAVAKCDATIIFASGDSLNVFFENECAWQQGPAEHVFSGQVELVQKTE